ncbi:MAG: transaldolase [Acidobacteria bacterium]|nr:transaldolase [Acidobacteriota bacterium]
MTRPQALLASSAGSSRFTETIIGIMKASEGKKRPPKPIRLVSHPLAKAVKTAGTAHIYTDTADWKEMHDLLVAAEEPDRIDLFGEIDGNTTNQPLVVKVLGRFLGGDESDNVVAWIKRLKAEKPDLTIEEAVVLIYTIINGRLGLEVVDYYSAGRTWQISLELHTSLAPDPKASNLIGWCLNRAVPNSFVKVAFTPDHPHSFLIARDLENQGIPVNFTTTFSARQVVAAALLANPHRTNVFLGRLSQGLGSELLGEQVVLETQRQITALRATRGVRTLNMLASVRRWQTMPLTAGCDVYTVPYPVLKEFLTQKEMGPDSIRNRVQEDYSGRLAVSDEVKQKVGLERIEKLYQVEPEFIEFLTKLSGSKEYATIDGDGLRKRFDEAGYGDFFYAPTESEWKELRKGKLPDLDSPMTRKLPLDTLYTLLAFGDFINFQERMDESIREPIRHLFA